MTSHHASDITFTLKRARARAKAGARAMVRASTSARGLSAHTN